VLLLPTGLAVVVVVGLFPIMSDATARFTTPLLVLLAALGLALSPPWRRGRLESWAVVSAFAVFAVYAAPIVLSGQATFAGYLTHVDQSTWFGVTDRIVDHGRSLGGLPDSNYKEMLHYYLPTGYPLGGFVPLGVGHKLTGQDTAWLFQPYLAFLATMLGLSLYSLGGRLITSPALRAAAAFIASQPALLFGFSLWAGIKEVSGAWIIALLVALAMPLVREGVRGRGLLPLATATAATVGLLSFAGGIWLVLPLAAVMGLSFRLRGRGVALAQAGSFLTLAGVLSIPTLLAVGTFWKSATNAVITGEVKGLLFHPLGWHQLFGIWPAGDFRTTTENIGITNVLIGLVAVAALIGLASAWRRRAWETLVYVGGTAGACLFICALGSPWVDAKALAMASPAMVFAAMSGALAAPWFARRLALPLAAAAIAGGILWSNALAYDDVSLAPRNELVELQRIGDRISGQGPTLLSDYDSYAARHFLRGADVQGPTSIQPFTFQNGGRLEGLVRRAGRPPAVRIVRPGDLLGSGFSFDSSEQDIASLLSYRTLVRRRSPLSLGIRGEEASSRPPSAYRLLWSGRYWEVWQRKPAFRQIVYHLALGSKTETLGKPACKNVLALARLAGPGGWLAAASDWRLTRVHLFEQPVWKSRDRNALLPSDLRSGAVEGRFSLPATGSYSAWMTGSFDRRVKWSLDGAALGKPRTEVNLSHPSFVYPSYLFLGTAQLGKGRHDLKLSYTGGRVLDPGSGTRAAVPALTGRSLVFDLGPVVLTRGDENEPVKYVSPSRARSLCGRSWDWLEALGAQSVG
jgi:hypothetical protein